MSDVVHFYEKGQMTSADSGYEWTQCDRQIRSELGFQLTSDWDQVTCAQCLLWKIKPEDDPVHHPRHYTSDPSGIEAIEITRHRNFNVGNAMKYLWRAGLKDGDGKLIEDLEKAIWYIRDEIGRLGGPGHDGVAYPDNTEEPRELTTEEGAKYFTQTIQDQQREIFGPPQVTKNNGVFVHTKGLKAAEVEHLTRILTRARTSDEGYKLFQNEMQDLINLLTKEEGN